MSFGENVGYYRKQLKITQEELAERLFVSRQTVSRWETDSTFPDVETIIKLCDIFDCNMDTLVRGNALDDAKSLQKEDDEIYRKKELQRKQDLADRIEGACCGTIMLLTTLAYILLGFLRNLWHPMWVLFISGGICCGICAVIVEGVLGVKRRN